MIPAPSETGHDAYDYQALFMDRDVERIRQNSILEVWRRSRERSPEYKPGEQMRLGLIR